MAAAVPLLIFPYNGNAIEAVDALGEAFELIGFIDDTPAKQGVSSNGTPVYSRQALVDHPQARVLAVPGSPTSFPQRRAAIDSLGVERERWATVIHPGAHVARTARIGCNVLVMAGAVITSNAVIGDHVCILPNTVVHHDAVVGAWSLIGSNVTVAGSVRIGENCYIGSGSSILNGLTLADGTLVGLGSNVLKNTAPGARVAGNPARVLG